MDHMTDGNGLTMWSMILERPTVWAQILARMVFVFLQHKKHSDRMTGGSGVYHREYGFKFSRPPGHLLFAQVVFVFL